ncbi:MULTISPECIES: phospholipase [unclassified Streptomyces]|uniref:phospholipase n=1 Tax=unclassified Streptomyces TaxID=2593676 RepID=UPI0022B74749|nr:MULTISPECIES: phospholipase [unclassified Streptomyces]MCZ7415751.1 phospholipase [Streptomyces sp. WMMC897]MCZ7434438.1 phospholipase [Streptomyces sp. WMMC1477]
MRAKTPLALATSAVSLATVVALASPATAVPADKSQVLYGWTQTSSSSYNSWLSAYYNKSAWSSYAFNWSTDFCSTSPDNPFGFPFKLACARHDFGYRNYKAAGTFSSHKNRLDSAFYADLLRVCDRYSGATEGSCNATAWTYYQAVRIFG